MTTKVTKAGIDDRLQELREQLKEDPTYVTEAEGLREEWVARLESMTDAATVEGRDLLASEQRELDALVAAVRSLDSAINVAQVRMRREFEAEKRTIAERRSAAAKAPIHVGGTGGSNPLASLRNARSPLEVRDAALRALEYHQDQLDPDAAARVEQDLRRSVDRGDTFGAEVVRAIGDPDYLRAFEKLARDPVRGHMEFTADEQAAFVAAQHVARAINVGTDANGGFMVPLTLDPAVMLTSDGVIDPLRRIARTVTTTTGHWKGITSAGVTAEYAAEGAEVADASATMAQPDVAVHRGDCSVEVTYEAAADTSFVSQLGELFADAKANIEGEKFWAGTSTNEPSGVVTGLDGTSSEVAPTTAETFAVDDVYKVLEAVPARFRRRAAWVGNLAVLNGIRQFGTADSHALWTHLADGTPALMLGKPVYEASESDGGFDAAATADNFILTCGDFRAGFVIADRLGSMMTVIEGLGANQRPTGTRHYTLWFRNGSEVVNASALRILNVATTA